MILPHISRQKVYKNVQQKTLVLEITSLFSMAAGHEKGVKRDDFGLLDVKNAWQTDGTLIFQKTNTGKVPLQRYNKYAFDYAEMFHSYLN